MRNITLIGMPGSGKSTVGVVLAKALGYEFLDGDLLIQSEQGCLLQQLIDRYGQKAFLDIEGDTLAGISCDKTVIAPGGSCVLRDKAMEHLKSLGQIVYLHLEYEELESRIHNLATRGIAFAPGQTLKDVYDQRLPLYQKWADVTLPVQGRSLEDTLSEVLRLLDRN